MLSPRNRIIFAGAGAARMRQISRPKQTNARKILITLVTLCVAAIKILDYLHRNASGSIILQAAKPNQSTYPVTIRMSTHTILSVEHLSKDFKSGDDTVHVLSDVSFAIEAGSTCAVVGPSGSGKTTLIAICAGLERPSRGSVMFADVALNHASEEKLARIRNQSVGFIFQSFQLIPSLTALENVMVPAEISGERMVRGSALELLGRVGLGKRLHHYPAELSGGEQQRVAIARAFMNAPKILFADEPTGNLHVETPQSIIKRIFDLNRSNGPPRIRVTHDRELTQLAGRVLSLRGGRLVNDQGNLTVRAMPAKFAL